MTPWPSFVRSPSPGTMWLPVGPQSNLLIHIMVFGPFSYLMISSCRPVKGNTGRATEPVSRLSVDISSIFESVRIQARCESKFNSRFSRASSPTAWWLVRGGSSGATRTSSPRAPRSSTRCSPTTWRKTGRARWTSLTWTATLCTTWSDTFILARYIEPYLQHIFQEHKSQGGRVGGQSHRIAVCGREVRLEGEATWTLFLTAPLYLWGNLFLKTFRTASPLK